jgi:hypothetical protein
MRIRNPVEMYAKISKTLLFIDFITFRESNELLLCLPKQLQIRRNQAGLIIARIWTNVTR